MTGVQTCALPILTVELYVLYVLKTYVKFHANRMLYIIQSLIFYSFFTYPENEGRKWLVIATREEREIIKKIKKN